MKHLSLPDSSSFCMIEEGFGEPLVYLPGFPDVGSVSSGLLPFQKSLTQTNRVITLWPSAAGPESNGDFGGWSNINDVAFRYLWLMDELGLERFSLVGHSLGAWIAAEISSWAPEKVKHLILLSPAGIDLEQKITPDIFMLAQPKNGFNRKDLRDLLFSDGDCEMAKGFFPDSPLDVNEEMRRFGMLRFAALIGWTPAYLYHADLKNRLLRSKVPSIVINGADDRFIGPEYGQQFAQLLHANHVVISGAGHAVHLESSELVAEKVKEFITM